MHFTPVKHNCSCFYAPYAYFGGLQHCQSPEKEHPLTAELLQQLHLELCLTHLCSRLEELPVGRESARFFLHTTFHLGPTTETTYRDASQHQLHYAEPVFVGALSGNHILGSLMGSSPPSHSLTAQARSAHHQMAAAASYPMDLYGKLRAGCLLYFQLHLIANQQLEIRRGEKSVSCQLSAEEFGNLRLPIAVAVRGEAPARCTFGVCGGWKIYISSHLVVQEPEATHFFGRTSQGTPVFQVL